MLERLQKIIAAAGISSRRKAEELILEGAVSVNGQPVTEIGAKADPATDHIKVKGKLINPLLEQRKNVYFLLNKPKGYLSSLSDPQNRPLVTEFIPLGSPRVFPVGRLDFNTEGLLILTNDGDLTNLVTKAGAHCPKVYHVKVKGTPSGEQLGRLRRGMRIEGEFHRIARLAKLDTTDAHNAWYEVVLHEGKNNQIRRMFDEIGHSVMKLRRVAIGHVTDKGLPVGDVRELLPSEVAGFFKAFAKKAAAPKRTARPKPDTAASADPKPLMRRAGKPKPQGRAKVKQAERLAKTVGKAIAAKERAKAFEKAKKSTPAKTGNPRQTGGDRVKK